MQQRVKRKEIVNDQECTDEEIAMVSTGESDMQRVKRKEMVNDKKYICTKGQKDIGNEKRGYTESTKKRDGV